MSRSLDFFSFEAAICTTSEPLFPGALDLDLPRVTNGVPLKMAYGIQAIADGDSDIISA
jgi:hypothetical protein